MKIASPEFAEFMSDRRNSFAAAYDPEDDAIMCRTKDGSITPDSADAFPHEAWHSIYDDKGAPGLLSSPDYSGPSRQDISDFCTTFESDPRFQRFLKFEQQQRQASRFNSMMKVRQRAVQSLNSNLEDIELVVQTMKDLDPDINMYMLDALGQCSGMVEDLRQRSEKLYSAIDATDFPSALELIDYLADNGATSIDRLDELLQLNETFAQHIQSLGVAELNQKTRDFKIYFNNKLTEAKNAYYDAQIAELEKKIEAAGSDAEKAVYRTEMDQYRILRKTEGLAAKSAHMMSLMSGMSDFGDVLSGAAYMIGSDTSAEQAFHNPDEIMARIVDSLYDLHFDKTTAHHFPLDELLLQFLGQFEYKGVPLFEKGIAKYRLGLQMIADGKDSEFVSAKLKYSTEFDYAGQHHEFPEAQFEIKGTLPVVEIPSFDMPDVSLDE